MPDKPKLRQCDALIYRFGKCVVMFYAEPAAADAWVKALAKKAQTNLDWHYFGGFVRVLHLGWFGSRARVQSAIDDLIPSLDGSCIRRQP